MAMMAWDCAISGKQGRATSVYSAAALEVLNRGHDPKALAQELVNGRSGKSSPDVVALDPGFVEQACRRPGNELRNATLHPVMPGHADRSHVSP